MCKNTNEKVCHFCEGGDNDNEKVQTYEEIYILGELIEAAHPECLDEAKDAFIGDDPLMNPNNEDDFNEQVNTSYE